MENKNIQSFKEFNENLNISDVNDSEKSKKEWWDKNYQRLIDLDIPYEDWKIIIKHKSDFDGVYNSTAKHRALYLLNTYSIEELENLINDYSFEETIEIGGRKYKKILSSLSEIADMQDKIKAGISLMGDIGYIKLPEDDKIYILLYSN
jgi:hypothetical protein